MSTDESEVSADHYEIQLSGKQFTCQNQVLSS